MQDPPKPGPPGKNGTPNVTDEQVWFEAQPVVVHCWHWPPLQVSHAGQSAFDPHALLQ